MTLHHHSGPLTGIRVISLAQYVAGPYCTQLLSDLGADVIKIENPRTRGDAARHIAPYQRGDESLFYECVNRGKRSIALDIKNKSGRQVLNRLIKSGDVFFTNMRPRALNDLGLTYSELRDANRAIVVCFLSGWGGDPETMDRPAYDYLVQAFTGHMELTAPPGEVPTRSAAPWIDTSSGITAALAIAAAIWQAKSTGNGSRIEIDMATVAMSQWVYTACWHLTGGYEPKRARNSEHAALAPSRLFRCKDGYLMLMCQTQSQWLSLCEVLREPSLSNAEPFQTMTKRSANRELLGVKLAAIFETDNVDVWLDKFGSRVPAQRVNTFPQAMTEFERLYPSRIVSTEHPDFGRVRMVGSSVVGDGDIRAVPNRSPLYSEHTTEILSECGYDGSDIGRLVKDGAIDLRGVEGH